MEKNQEEIRENIKQRYRAVAKSAQQGSECETTQSSSCCEPQTAQANCCEPTQSYTEQMGYTQEELADLPQEAVQSCAACGNPTAIAALKEGDVVIDLGSGGGMDALLASKKVGSNGRVIGIDMTPEMLELARKNAKEMGVENVEFREGYIEDIPVEDGTADVIISNCVINLSTDKDKVFREAYRVLKPGGRITVSDIVTEGPLPDHIKNNPDMWASCISGALDQEVYLEKIRNAGFHPVKVLDKRSFSMVYSIEVEAIKPL